ncbi:MAG: T9SS type A sorting domain-containing protein [Chitinophagales bacterium]|nr:T9SS type A sorting domain-containing protein [Chitinophagales bacterium]
MKNLISTKWLKGTFLTAVTLALPFVMNGQTSSQNLNPIPSQPQRANVWFFGDRAGLDFSNGRPVALTTGAMQAFEGTSSMCDKNGQLLFYSNGGDLPYAGGIWNRNHQLMPNGNMTGRGGCNSSFQSSLILPQPRSNSVYYLFTVDCIENASHGGLRYNIIDMNADGGLGDVVSASNQLLAPTDESLTAIPHANRVDYWVITHKIRTDSFYVYHLAPQGIVGVVKTKIGRTTPDYAGTLTASPNGQKLVYSGLTWTSLFDFDNRTGKLSNHVDLGIASYSAAFSPNCQYVYVADGVGKTIYQYDVISNRPSTTGVVVGQTASTGIGGMQLGPDGRIYVARFISSQYLGVIEQPNVRGTDCIYTDNGIYLAGKIGKGGLPNYPSGIVGECIDYQVENTNDYAQQDLNIMVDQLNSHNISIRWTDFSGNNLYRVLYRPVGSQDWSEVRSDVKEANLEDLTAETTYEIRVIAADGMTADYEPLTGHLTADDIANAKLSSTTSDAITATTTSTLTFDLYPNPTNSAANIMLNLGDVSSNVNVKVIDAKGQLVGGFNTEYISGYNRYPISIDNLSNGVYNVMVETASSSDVKKLVIMR